MRRHTLFLFLALAVGWTVPARAQTPQWVSALLEAARLPVVTLEARRDGLRDDEIAALLRALRNARVAAPEAVVIVDSARAVRHDYGPVDNFGEFVQSQLAAGKRGTELAAAIRAEHARMGKGKANAGGAHADTADDHGRPGGRAGAPAPKPGTPATGKPPEKPRGKPVEKPHGKPADRGNGRPINR